MADTTSTSAPKRGRKRKAPDPPSADDAAAEISKTMKRSRKTRKATKRVINWLEESPTDIMLEIMSYLNPIDVLRMSYTSKSARMWLTSPDGKVAWVHARANVPNLPELPPDLTEWSYAGFIFQQICQMCGRISRDKGTMAGLRIRLCKRCTDEHCINGFVASQLLGDASLLNLVPGVVVRCLDSKHSLFYRKAVMELFHRRAAIPDATELAAFDKKRAQYADDLESSSGAITKFIIGVQKKAARELRTQHRDKCEDFKQRLEQLGHDRQDMEGLSFRKFARTVLKQPFRKCKWERLRPHLEDLLSGKKKRRMDAKYKPRNETKLRTVFMTMFLAQQSDTARNTFLPILDFLQLPTVKGLLGNYFPENEFESAVLSATPSITEEVDCFCAAMRRDLVDLWCTGRGCPRLYNDKSDAWNLWFLSLAWIVFVIPGAGGQHRDVLLHYPTLFKRQVIGSASMIDRWASSVTNIAQPDLYEKWSFYRSHIRYSQVHQEAMRETLQTYYLDRWHAASLSELQQHVGWEDKFTGFLNSRTSSLSDMEDDFQLSLFASQGESEIDIE
ncbi:hypothetical protein CALCODRAFT_557946 [Calocera cornea HHB12733]|uniref:F-box domain-containing protein n=1 Tax=Calocera cornea HHB12733 TaxID=1353952 RepID=A0A165DEV2_9BASI|nr:hypothetical protein CALCODRAFT_557946 [Calocera cornea HHB12733]